jgi:hypothetical protein
MTYGKGPPGSRAEPGGSGIPSGQDRQQRRLGADHNNPTSRCFGQARRVANLPTALPPAAKASLRQTKEGQP